MMPIDRREFVKLAGAQAGALAAGAAAMPGSVTANQSAARRAPARGQTLPDIVVIGAGSFGAWTALNLRELGANVTLVDTYGPGNSKSTSGGETRGVRTAYGENELWTSWASRAIDKWKEFDAEWGQPSELRLFFSAGDLIMREEEDNFLRTTQETWDKAGVVYEVLDHDEVAYRYPQIDITDIEIALFERDAGVVRARRAVETVAEVFRKKGGEIVLARAMPGERTGDRLEDVAIRPGERIAADMFVFALGPFFPNVFPQLMSKRIRRSIGHVYYYGTPPGDNRFTHPNMPSYNFQGVTGWPSLPSDPRGFRVRTGGRPSEDPELSVRHIADEYLERPRSFVSRRFPALKDSPLLETRACHYEGTVDDNWIIGLHPEYSNVWFAGGGNAEGFKFGPVLGEYIARRILGDDPHPELADRFRLKDEVFEDEPDEGRRRGRGS
jgi:sarcosine oxidase